jgi:uncharacterized protein
MALVTYKLDPWFPNGGNSNVPMPAAVANTLSSVTPLSNGNEANTLRVLSNPSLTNVIMSGFIRDNGLDSPQNRGCFYACHNEGKLTGIALIGHTTLFEAFDESAIQAFAALTRKNASPHLLMGEHNTVRQFWNNYALSGEPPRLLHPILFLQRRDPFTQHYSVDGLRLATPNDLEQLVRAQAAMAFETSAVDPLAKDPTGFRDRYLRRIEKNRVWVVIKKGRLIFKTDVTAESSDVAYLEGVYVSPEERGKGIGRGCLETIGRILLQRKKAIYLFVEEENARLQSFYFKLGFTLGGHYDLLYF